MAICSRTRTHEKCLRTREKVKIQWEGAYPNKKEAKDEKRRKRSTIRREIIKACACWIQPVSGGFWHPQWAWAGPLCRTENRTRLGQKSMEQSSMASPFRMLSSVRSDGGRYAMLNVCWFGNEPGARGCEYWSCFKHSLQGVSLALVWKVAMLTVHFCIWKGYCLQFLQTGSEFLEGTKQMGYTKWRHFLFSHAWGFYLGVLRP